MLAENTVVTLIDCFSELPDPRIDRCMIDIIVIALRAVICGAEGPTEMEAFGEAKEKLLKKFLDLPKGIPSHDTFGRVLSAIDPKEFERCLLKWVNSQVKLSEKEIVALDGKTLRRSHDRSKDQDAIEIVSAWAVSERLTLGQVKVDSKRNEITAVPEVLKALNIEGCIVTVDALNTQKTIASQVREQKADYVLALKNNHKTLYQQVEEYLTTVRKDRTHGFQISRYQTTDGEHRRIETRRYLQVTAPDWLPEKQAWRDLTSVGMVESTREINGKVTTEIRYFLSSLPVDAQDFGRAARSHWGIENSCHWVLDVVFREDESCIRIGNAADNMSTLRRMALNLLRRETSVKQGIQVKRLSMSCD